MPDFPSADDVAIAIVAACRQTGEDPLQVGAGVQAMHARRYAFTVLAEQFPVAKKSMLARLVGASSYESYAHATRERWYKISTAMQAKREYLRMGGSIRGL